MSGNTDTDLHSVSSTEYQHFAEDVEENLMLPAPSVEHQPVLDEPRLEHDPTLSSFGSQPDLLDKQFPPTLQTMAKNPEDFDYSWSPDNDFDIVHAAPKRSDDEHSIATVSSTAGTDISSAETVDFDGSDSDADDYLTDKDEALAARTNKVEGINGAEKGPVGEESRERHDSVFTKRSPSVERPQSHDTNDWTGFYKSAFQGFNLEEKMPVEFERQLERELDDELDDPVRASDATITPTRVRDGAEPEKIKLDAEKAMSSFYTILWILLGSLSAAALACATVLLMAPPTPVDPASELAFRSAKLSQQLDICDQLTSSWGSVEPRNILHYPSSTETVNGLVSIAVSFPTAVSVLVAKPHQLFVSLPRNEHDQYPRDARIGVIKDGRTLENVNRTHLIHGVVHLALDLADANGVVNVSVLFDKRHESVKVYLGNRLFKRSTYESAAAHVEHSVRRDASQLRSVVQALQSSVGTGTQSAVDRSAKTAAMFGNWTASTMSGISGRVADSFNRTHAAAHRLTRLAGDSISRTHTKTVKDMSDIASTATTTFKNQGVRLGEIRASASYYLSSNLRTARHRALAIRDRLRGAKVSTPILEQSQSQHVGGVSAWFSSLARYPKDNVTKA